MGTSGRKPSPEHQDNRSLVPTAARLLLNLRLGGRTSAGLVCIGERGPGSRVGADDGWGRPCLKRPIRRRLLLRCMVLQ